MNKAKENRGITLITVIIAIIIMSILVTVGTYSGINSYKNAKVTQFITQMQLIQLKVDELVNDNAYSKLGITITEEQKSILVLAYNNGEISDNTSEYFNQFKYFSTNDLINFDLENITADVLINFTTREVVSLDGIEYENKIYYTQYLLPNGQQVIKSEHQDKNFNFDQNDINKSIDGLNCEVTISSPIINGTLSYIEEGTNTWNTITNYTKRNEDYSVNIAKSGRYIFKLKDNTSEVEKTVNIIIVTTNRPKTSNELENYDYSLDSTKWAYTTNQDENQYVWVPRFIYKYNEETGENDIKFIKGNSNIATDNTYIDTENWTIPSNFENDTGKWVYTEIKTDLDLITLINGEATKQVEI